MSELRVLHVTGAYPDSSNPHRGSFIRAQVDSLRAHGVDAGVCVLEGAGMLKYALGPERIRRALKQKDYQLVHAHYMYAGWSARLATTLPLVVSYMGNDVFGDCDENGHYPVTSAVSHRALSNLLAALSSHAVVKSRGLADELHLGARSIVPNGVDLALFRPMPAERKRLGIAEDAFVVLFAGKRSDPVKRHGLAAEAVARARSEVPSAELVVVEGKSQEDVRDMMNAADCLLLTSAHEGSPNVVKEALATNLPVVSLPVGDVRERLEGLEGCHVVERADAADLSRALVAVARRRARLAHGRDRAAAISLDWAADELIRIYREVLGR